LAGYATAASSTGLARALALPHLPDMLTGAILAEPAATPAIAPWTVNSCRSTAALAATALLCGELLLTATGLARR